jgi:hypothetical protein
MISIVVFCNACGVIGLRGATSRSHTEKLRKRLINFGWRIELDGKDLCPWCWAKVRTPAKR